MSISNSPRKEKRTGRLGFAWIIGKSIILPTRIPIICLVLMYFGCSCRLNVIKWILAGGNQEGWLTQNRILYNGGILSYTIRPLQCTSYFPTTNGPGAFRSAMVTLSRRHHHARNCFQRRQHPDCAPKAQWSRVEVKPIKESTLLGSQERE